MKKYVSGFFVAVILIPTIALSIWYCISFLPHVSELEKFMKQGDMIVLSAPHILYDMAVADSSKKSIRAFAIMKAYWNLVYNKNPKRILIWHLNEALWFYSSHLHFSDKQVFSIWAYCAPYEHGHGLNNASSYYFKKPLSELDERSLAAIIVAVRNPLIYMPGTNDSEQRVKIILAKLKKS